MPKEECGVTDQRIQEATRCWEDPVPEAESPGNCENKPFPNIPFILAKGKEYNRRPQMGSGGSYPASTTVLLEEEASLRKENKNESTFKNEYILHKVWIFDRNLHFWAKLELPLF